MHTKKTEIRVRTRLTAMFDCCCCIHSTSTSMIHRCPTRTHTHQTHTCLHHTTCIQHKIFCTNVENGCRQFQSSVEREEDSKWCIMNRRNVMSTQSYGVHASVCVWYNISCLVSIFSLAYFVASLRWCALCVASCTQFVHVFARNVVCMCACNNSFLIVVRLILCMADVK